MIIETITKKKIPYDLKYSWVPLVQGIKDKNFRQPGKMFGGRSGRPFIGRHGMVRNNFCFFFCRKFQTNLGRVPWPVSGSLLEIYSLFAQFESSTFSSIDINYNYRSFYCPTHRPNTIFLFFEICKYILSSFSFVQSSFSLRSENSYLDSLDFNFM